jgi:hypothetical protein
MRIVFSQGAILSGHRRDRRVACRQASLWFPAEQLR